MDCAETAGAEYFFVILLKMIIITCFISEGVSIKYEKGKNG